MVKKLPPQDQELWENFTKDVNRIKCDKVTPDENKFVKTFEKPQFALPQVKSTQKVNELHANELKNIKLEGRIDLHGFTQAAAEQTLREFLQLALHRNWRWVIVITGKGSCEKPSVLREQTPRWLQSMPEFVTGYATALPKDGGEGALYVKIRKKMRHSS